MGLMDKMKAAAQDVAVQAKSATAQAQTKIEQAQTRKKMDEAAQKLGYLIHAERVRAVAPGAKADRLIAEISTLETELAASEASAPVGPGPEAPVATTPGEPPAEQSPGATP